jgi:serine/threonine protein phosphatase PrpC
MSSKQGSAKQGSSKRDSPEQKPAKQRRAKMRVVAWGLTDTGCKREHNEDSLLLDTDINLYGVADGMGGHAAGDRASNMAVSVLKEEMHTTDFAVELVAHPKGAEPGLDDGLGQRLAEAARNASRRIYDTAQQDPSAQGMGTTLTSILLHGGRAYIAHVGDSRCYLFRDGRIDQLTVDHSWIEEQVRAGYMTREEAEESALKHVVTRSVGFEREVEVDVMAMPALMGDCYLLCSDGLSNYLTEAQLRGYLIRGYYSEVPRRLVETAKALGGEDNVTVVVVYVANDCDVES